MLYDTFQLVTRNIRSPGPSNSWHHVDTVTRNHFEAERRKETSSAVKHSHSTTPYLKYPVEPLGSRGPVSAEVMGSPELADNLLRPLASGRGTDKGTCSYSPSPLAGGSMQGKPSSPPQDDVGCFRYQSYSNESLETTSISTDHHSNSDDHTNKKAFALQRNINGFHNNLADLEMLVRELCPTVIAIQEVHRASKTGMGRTLSGGYNWELKINQNNHSVAIGILAHISFTAIDLDTTLPIIAIRIDSPLPISIVNFYLPCSKIDNLDQQFGKIMEKIPEPRLLLGDCNGHHPAWGSSSTNLRGRILTDMAEVTDSVILNDGSKTYISGGKESTVDITMVC